MEGMPGLLIIKAFEKDKVKNNMGTVCSNTCILWLLSFSEGEDCEVPQTRGIRIKSRMGFYKRQERAVFAQVFVIDKSICHISYREECMENPN